MERSRRWQAGVCGLTCSSFQRPLANLPPSSWAQWTKEPGPICVVSFVLELAGRSVVEGGRDPFLAGERERDGEVKTVIIVNFYGPQARCVASEGSSFPSHPLSSPYSYHSPILARLHIPIPVPLESRPLSL